MRIGFRNAVLRSAMLLVVAVALQAPGADTSYGNEGSDSSLVRAPGLQGPSIRDVGPSEYHASLFLPLVLPHVPVPRFPGAWHCLDDGSPDPCSNDLTDIQVAANGTGWAVGGNGVILGLRDGTWSRFESPTPGDYHSVDMVGSDLAWAVAEGGTVVHWDGTAWRVVLRRHDVKLFGIDMLSENVGWVVGHRLPWPDAGRADGVVLRWDGHDWTEEKLTPGVTMLTSLSMSSIDDGWALAGTELVRWHDGRWIDWPWSGSAYLTAATSISADDAWLVDQEGCWHWDGTAWTSVPVPEVHPTDLILTDAGAVYLHADRQLLRWQQASWIPDRELDDSAPRQHAMSLDASGRGWSVGAHGSVARIGDTWQLVLGAYAPTVKQASFLAPDEGWAVGGEHMLYWDGTDWTAAGSPAGARPVAIDMLDSSWGWAVGADTIYHYSGDGWAERATFPEWDLLAVGQASRADAWAVGLSVVDTSEPLLPKIVAVAARWNGSRWQSFEVDLDGPLRAVDVVSANDVWFVGGMRASWRLGENTCVIAHWDGRRFVDYPCPATHYLTDVHMLSDTEGWAVGGYGERPVWDCGIVRFDGESWSSVARPSFCKSTPFCTITAVHMIEPDDGWAVGECNSIFHWDGRLWLPKPHPAPPGALWRGEPFSDVVFVAPDSGWVFGRWGRYLRFGPRGRIRD